MALPHIPSHVSVCARLNKYQTAAAAAECAMTLNVWMREKVSLA